MLIDVSRFRRSKVTTLPDVLPWALMWAEGVVLNKYGAFQRTIRFRGPDLESSEMEHLVANAAALNNALKRFGGAWGLYFEAQRRRSPDYRLTPRETWSSDAAWLIEAERQAAFAEEGAHLTTEFYITFTYLVPKTAKNWVERLLFENVPAETVANYRDHLETFMKETNNIIGLMRRIPMPLVEPLDAGETLTYLHSTISTRRQKIGVPQDCAQLIDDLIVDTEFRGGTKPMLGDKHIRTVSILNYMSLTNPGLFDSLNDLAIEYRLTTRWLPYDKAKAMNFIETVQDRWVKGRKTWRGVLAEAWTRQPSEQINPTADRRAVEATLALGDVADDYVSMGVMTPAITVWGDTAEEADKRAGTIQEIIDGLTATSKIETWNAPEAWLGTIPGHAFANVRRKPMTSMNLSHMIPATAIWSGPDEVEHMKKITGNGSPLIHATTGTSTPFRFDLFQGDVGHMLLVGPPGSGKSFLLSTTAMQWGRYPDSKVVFFDKGGSARVSTLASGGIYYSLGNRDVAFQPLASIDDLAERTWARDWVLDILSAQGITITTDIRAEVWRALGGVADMPVELRTITNLQQNARIREIKDGLAQFTLAGPYGYLLDAATERLESARWITFEMGELIEKKDAVSPVLTYLFHWLERHVFDGSPTLLILDEAWRFLANGVFAEKIREWEKEMRKHNVAVVFATQSLVDVTNSEFSQAIIESSMTKVFLPNREALKPETRKGYQSIGLNSRQIQLISSATPKLDYYVSCPDGNRLFNLGSGDVGLALCGSSGKADHRAADAIVKRGGNFLAEWLRHKRLHSVADYVEDRDGGIMAAE